MHATSQKIRVKKSAFRSRQELLCRSVGREKHMLAQPRPCSWQALLKSANCLECRGAESAPPRLIPTGIFSRVAVAIGVSRGLKWCESTAKKLASIALGLTQSRKRGKIVTSKSRVTMNWRAWKQNMRAKYAKMHPGHALTCGWFGVPSTLFNCFATPSLRLIPNGEKSDTFTDLAMASCEGETPGSGNL